MRQNNVVKTVLIEENTGVQSCRKGFLESTTSASRKLREEKNNARGIKDRVPQTAANRVVFRREARRFCAVLNCAAQQLCEKIPSFQDRASCLPESSWRALVADAREIRQYQMHPSLSQRSVTDTESVALPSFSVAAKIKCFRHAAFNQLHQTKRPMQYLLPLCTRRLCV
jgi:hypothetical protein